MEVYSLYENSQLVCQPCLMKKEGESSGSVSFLEQQKWYKKHWKIDLTEWLENFSMSKSDKCLGSWMPSQNASVSEKLNTNLVKQLLVI